MILRTRREVIQAYAVIFGAAWVTSLALSSAAHWIQHAVMPERYQLLPVNLVAFYLVPLLSLAMVWVANRTGIGRRPAWVACVLAMTFTAARLLYWGAVAREYSENPGSSIEVLVSRTPPSFWATATLGLCSYVALAKVAYDVFIATGRVPQPSMPFQTTSGVDG